MRFQDYLRRRSATILIVIFLASTVFFVIREISITRDKLPLEISQKVRNLSTKKFEWEVAVSADPGDTLEHFTLVRLSSDYPNAVRSIRITADKNAQEAYREGTLASKTLGINTENAQTQSRELFEKEGIFISELAPGEFIDLSWQTQVADNATFEQKEVLLLQHTITVSARHFSSKIVRSIASLFSSVERTNTPSSIEPFYQPKAYSMAPRRFFDTVGAGVLIVGEDFSGLSKLAIKETGTALVWRLVSNELIEAGIPAGLAPGVYTIELSDAKGKHSQDLLFFEVRPSRGRAVVVATTPSVVRSGKTRIIMLQGIRLNENFQFTLGQDDSKQIVALSHTAQINERILTAEISRARTSENYTILVHTNEQEATIIVN
ncbi:hypothetical protein BK004_03445 [bacterium CG10_46_32]|nr:MAG: hypothetical protein BK004_03445 [bacterium CG10_46_32]PIR55980.1 MAG: hypothetical protein COU73_03475 [Parcubacteria group bacterium CG10_big_fil_rev_8_21_14_0_10_46_32]